MTLYQICKAKGLPLDNHESDLYVQDSPEAVEAVRATGHSFSRFLNKIDGKVWLDIPFAYDPWWEDRVRRTVDLSDKTC